MFFFSKKITNKRRLPTHTSRDTDTDTNTNHPVNQKNKHQSADDPFDYCSICQIPLNIEAVASSSDSKIDTIVFCKHCQSKTCKSSQCAIWMPSRNHWECSNCHHFDSVVYVRAYDWIFSRLNRIFDDKANVTLVTKTTSINDIHSNSGDDVMLELNGIE